MGSFAAVVLICLAGTSREACDESTAVEVRSILVESELGCTSGWQEIIARAGGEHGVGSATYLKTLCRRIAAGSESRR